MRNNKTQESAYATFLLKYWRYPSWK